MHGNRGQRPRWQPAHVALLRQIPLLAGVADGQDQSLAELAAWRSYHQGERMLGPGDGQGCVFLLANGRARIYGVTPTGVELSVVCLSTGAVIDPDDAPSVLSGVICVEALEEATVIRLPREPFHHAVFASPEAAARLHAQGRERLMEMARLLWEIESCDVSTRLQHELARLADEDPDHIVWVTHEELGHRIGVTREVVTRLLPSLRTRGLIAHKSHHRGIRVLDRERLAAAGDGIAFS